VTGFRETEEPAVRMHSSFAGIRIVEDIDGRIVGDDVEKPFIHACIDYLVRFAEGMHERVSRLNT
jgi:hypothetical protein